MRAAAGRSTLQPSLVGACASLVVLACSPAPRESASQADATVPIAPALVPDSLLITARRVGGFGLGVTLEEARRAHPGASFLRVSDGDGVALVEVTLAGGEALILFAGEDDPEGPIDWSRRITTIEAYFPAFQTVDGVHPGLPVAEVERTWGEVRRITRSEIEAREFIEFSRQPAGLTLRLDYTGRFPADSSVTTEYEAQAAIYSISIADPGP